MAASPVLQACTSDEPPDRPVERLLPAGTALGDGGRYTLIDIVAIGGMATIYLATDARLDSTCALKAQYMPTADPDEATAFRNEARLLAEIQFPGVVAVRDVFDEEDFSFMAMDFIDGENLYDRHRRTGRQGEDSENLPIAPAPEDQVVLYALALARTLDHLHTRAQAIVYRDMKPHNVMRRSTDGSLVLLDFGIARTLNPRDKSCPNDDLGTPGYAAPEQYDRAGVINARTDIYGLGVLLTELATGYNPRAESAEQLMPPLASLRCSISPTLSAILQKCVEHDPAQRFQSAVELSSALEQWRKTPRKLRRKSIPKQAWTIETAGRATGPLQTHQGMIYAADSAGAMYAIESSVGHIDFELNAAPNLPIDIRYRLLQPIPGELDSATIARVSSSAGGSNIMLYSDTLLPIQRIDAPGGRVFASWCGNGDLVMATPEPPRITRFSQGDEGQWQHMWRIKLVSPPVGVAACGDDALILNSNGVLKRIDRFGERVWQQTLPLWNRAAPSAMRLLGNVVVMVAARGEAPMTGLDESTGAILWQTAGAGDIVAEPLLDPEGATLIAATRDVGLTVIRLADGDIVARHSEFTKPIVGISHFMPASSVLVLTEYGADARVILYDAAQQRIVWSDEIGERGAIAGPALCGDVIAVQDLTGQLRAWRWEDWR
jgi:serine/threonine protein kinase